jgi:hypothetical protein
MHRTSALVVAGFLLIGASAPGQAAGPHPSCRPAAARQEALSDLDPIRLDCRDTPCQEDATARAKALMRRDPRDFFTRMAYVRWAARSEQARTPGGLARIRRAARLADGEAADPEALFLAGQLLRGQQAVRMHERALELDPSFPWAHLGLAEALRVAGQVERASKEIEFFLQACPARFQEPLAWGPRGTTPLLWTSHVPVLRDAVASAEPDERIAYLPLLWRLEFFVTPPGDHPHLRSRLREELAVLENEKRDGSLRWWRTLLEGYEMALDEDGRARAEAGLVEHFPCERDAVAARARQWGDTGSGPGPRSLEPREARRLLDEASRWAAQCPDDQSYARLRFLAASRAEGLDAAALPREARRYLKTWDPDTAPTSVYHGPPYDVAEAFLSRDIDVRRIPSLVRQERRILQEQRLRLPLNELQARTREVTEYNRMYQDFDLAVLLGNAWLKSGRPRVGIPAHGGSSRPSSRPPRGRHRCAVSLLDTALPAGRGNRTPGRCGPVRSQGRVHRARIATPRRLATIG